MISLEEHKIETFSTGTRPEFLFNKKRLNLMKKNFSGKIQFDIGLESLDDNIRKYCLGKGPSFTTALFLKAIKTIKKEGFSFLSYILLGKPFLTIKEDIYDAVNSINFTVRNGGIVVVFMMNMQPHTLIHWLYKNGKYKIPSLWCAIKLLEMLKPSSRNKVWIKGIDKGSPFPIQFPSNCNICTSIVHNCLVGWNFTHNYDIIKNILNCCDCREKWEELFTKSNRTPLKERVDRLIFEIAPVIQQGGCL